jgi:hypothetical protein
MPNVYHFPAQALGPEDLRLAAEAFEAALRRLDESTCETSPHTIRRLMAQYVIEHALNGERELKALRDGALAYVAAIGVAQAA